MAKLFPLEVHTPTRLFFSAPVEAFTALLEDGEIGVHGGHAPFAASVRTGIFKIKDKEGVWREAFTTEGMLEVRKGKTVLMVGVAEWPQEIDAERARAAKNEAEETLKVRILKFETEAAKAQLRRAEMRLKVFARNTEQRE